MWKTEHTAADLEARLLLSGQDFSISVLGMAPDACFPREPKSTVCF